MSTQRKERCETCKWWKWWNEINGFGRCHVNPPTLIQESEDERGAFPRTWKSEFCGQWSAASEEDPQTLKEGEIAVRVDVLNAFRISLTDIREVTSAMQRQSIEDLQDSIKASGAWMLNEMEAKYGAKVCENGEERVD